MKPPVELRKERAMKNDIPAESVQPSGLVSPKWVRKFSEDDFLQDNTRLAIHGWEFKNLEGRMLTLIESMGLPGKQEDAIKSYARKEIWQTIHQTFILPTAITDMIHESFESGLKDIAR